MRTQTARKSSAASDRSRPRRRTAPKPQMQSVQAIWKDPRNERSRNIRPPEQAWLVIDRSFLRRLRFGFGLRLSRLFQFGAMLRWYINNRGHLAALQGPQVTDNRPAITHRDV